MIACVDNFLIRVKPTFSPYSLLRFRFKSLKFESECFSPCSMSIADWRSNNDKLWGLLGPLESIGTNPLN